VAVYLDSWAIEAQFTSGVWTDITADVITVADSVRAEWGISDNGPTDRVASTGRLTFSLNNGANNSIGLAGYYSPGHANCRSGFTTGIPVRARFTYEGYTRTKFYGRIAPDGIKPAPGIYGNRRTEITVLDWMNQAATHELNLPAYTTNKRIDEVVPLIVANMPLAPLSTDYKQGEDTFVSVFDTVSNKTRAMSEFSKLALSEWGYVYLKHTSASDEVLTVEGRFEKTNNPSLSQIPNAINGYLLKEDGGYLLKEDGGKIALDSAGFASFSDIGKTDSQFSFGKHLTNDVSVTSYPRNIGTAAEVLFTLQSPIEIAAGGSVTDIIGQYRDPSGGAWRVAGKGMIAPVATTDYKMYFDSAGTGIDATGSLTVTPTYAANEVSYVLVSTATATGYVTHLQARGTGIYLYDSVEYNQDDDASKLEHGTQPLSISMPYQDDTELAQYIAVGELANLKDPRMELDKWVFFANRDGFMMNAFLMVEPGDKAHFYEEQVGFDKDRWIDAVEWELIQGRALKVGWKTRDAAAYGYWQLEVVGYSELGETTMLG
jgi:hypothetical protein